MKPIHPGWSGLLFGRYVVTDLLFTAACFKNYLGLDIFALANEMSMRLLSIYQFYSS